MLAVAVWSVMIVITTCAWLVLWYVTSSGFFGMFAYEDDICLCFLSFCSFRSFPPLWPLLTVYLTWARCIDDSPERGGRSSQWFRSSRFWRYFADYYPASYVCLSFSSRSV
jgi:2-acylglycerol O-acyltransferase 2